MRQRARAPRPMAPAVHDQNDYSSRTYDVDQAGSRRRTLGYGDLHGTPRMVLRGGIEAGL
ncbi:hypothetical protein PV330_09950 [Streptomyces caniscabiei]|uniref:hypothetical protein n=1 Tax=Streptomyces caniscabiei TaxID=2746961 RepID=UPI0029BBD97E|nr:hypothetical protein [Streptomyces caniscabiei]MDX2600350.1 hypothetical protein [Streptomyces caniscabiei]